MLEAFYWWLTSFLLCLVSFPICFVLFRNLVDRGYGFARPLSLLIVGYIFWIFVTVGVFPNNRATALVVTLLVLAISAFISFKKRVDIVNFFRHRWGMVLALEMVFVTVFFVWGVMRAFTPAIAHTEQPMDFAILNGILTSSNFPPTDPWYAGESISYYYFGYLMSAILTQLTGIASSITYNLSLMLIAGMAAVGIFSLVCNLVYHIRYANACRPNFRTPLIMGVIGVILLMFMGNLVGALEFLHVNNFGSAGFWRWINVNGLDGASNSSSWYPNEFWFWFRDTRIISSIKEGVSLDLTITEFPFFSFLLGDLHPHVMSLPFTIMVAAMSYNLLMSEDEIGFKWLRARPWEVLLLVLSLGGLGFLNSWDLPTFSVLFLMVFLLKVLRDRKRGVRTGVRELVCLMMGIMIGMFLLYAPFYLHFDSQAAQEIGIPILLPVRREMTRGIHLFLTMGPLILLGLALIAKLGIDNASESFWTGWHRLKRGRSEVGARGSYWLASPLFWCIVLPLVPFAIWVLMELGFTLSGRDVEIWGYGLGIGETILAIGVRFWHLIPGFVVLTCTLWLLYRYSRLDDNSRPYLFLLLMLITAFSLLLLPELFHIPDVFSKSSPRLNTVFKFYYQAWVLLAIIGPVAVYGLLLGIKGLGTYRKIGFGFVSIVTMCLIGLSMLYIPPALYGKTDGFQGPMTLNAGDVFMKNKPYEYDAIRWLKSKSRDALVIVEGLPLDHNGLATGDYRSEVGRISQRTGLPTILAWPGHQQQWGRDLEKDIPERTRVIDTIYRSSDSEMIQKSLKIYNVSYVIVGGLERDIYGSDVEGRLADFMDIAYQNDGVVIYQPKTPTD